MARDYRPDGLGALSLGSLSTAGWTGSWYQIPAFKNHALAVNTSGSTAAITGNVTLQGRLSTAGLATTLAIWSSTMGDGAIASSTNSVIVDWVRVTSTGLASTASTGTVAAVGACYYGAV